MELQIGLVECGIILQHLLWFAVHQVQEKGQGYISTQVVILDFYLHQKPLELLLLHPIPCLFVMMAMSASELQRHLDFFMLVIVVVRHL